MNIFAKIVNGQKPWAIFVKNSIMDDCEGPKPASVSKLGCVHELTDFLVLAFKNYSVLKVISDGFWVNVNLTFFLSLCQRLHFFYCCSNCKLRKRIFLFFTENKILTRLTIKRCGKSLPIFWTINFRQFFNYPAICQLAHLTSVLRCFFVPA